MSRPALVDGLLLANGLYCADLAGLVLYLRNPKQNTFCRLPPLWLLATTTLSSCLGVGGGSHLHVGRE